MFYLMPATVGAGPTFAMIMLIDSGSIRGKQMKHSCQYAGSIQVFPPFTPPPISRADVGKRVRVEGYSCSGTLQFFGPHKTKENGDRCGIVLEKPLGKNNGTVKGHKCKPNSASPPILTLHRATRGRTRSSIYLPIAFHSNSQYPLTVPTPTADPSLRVQTSCAGPSMARL